MLDKCRMPNWLDPFLKHARMTQEALADELGVSRVTINRLAQDHSKLKRSRAEEIASILNVSANDLMIGNFSLGFEEEVQSFIAAPTTTIPDLAIHGGLGNGGLLDVLVDHSGRPIDVDQLRGYWSFPEYMLAGIRNLNRVYAWEVRGDSMEPTLAGGSVVFVDTSQNTLPPDDIYAVDFGDGLMVKRVKLVPRTDQIEIISDNQMYGSDRIHRKDVRIYGRVIGWFQWRG